MLGGWVEGMERESRSAKNTLIGSCFEISPPHALGLCITERRSRLVSNKTERTSQGIIPGTQLELDAATLFMLLIFPA